MSLRRRLVLSVLVMLLLGVAAGLVWVQVAEPAEWEVTSTGIFLTEAASTGQFSVIALFVMIGAVVSLVWGAWVAWVLEELGWLVTPVIVIATAVASLIAWRIGVELGPPDPRSVTGLAIGDRIPSEIAVDGLVPFVVWPMFGLVGLIAVTWADQRLHRDRVDGS